MLNPCVNQIDKSITANKPEEWVDIFGFNGAYKVSSFGRVKSVDREIHCSDGRVRLFKERVLKPYVRISGYLNVKLSVRSVSKTYDIHRLVALSFSNNPDTSLHVNHKDGNKLNNHLDNLELITRGENERHAYATGLKKPPIGMLGRFGKDHHLSKIVNQIDLNGNKIATYYSINEAERKTGIKACNIGSVCKKRVKKAGGYYWEYGNN